MNATTIATMLLRLCREKRETGTEKEVSRDENKWFVREMQEM